VKILVADDDATSLLLVTMELQSLGHACDTATDGTEAWDTFQSGHPDVVISDWMMPGQNGPQLCARIRADPQGANVYLILLTSHGADEQILEGIRAGADDYLVKPLEPDLLEHRLVAAAARMAFLGGGETGIQASELGDVGGEPPGYQQEEIGFQ
jgi:DNA-binding response OmpR family regulator